MAIKGLRSLEAKLKRIPQEARSAIRQALAEGADAMVGTMKSLAPVRTGALQKSIVATFGDGSAPKYAAFRARSGRRAIKSNDPDLSVTITAGNTGVRYAHLVEFGTSPHINGGLFAGSQHPGTTPQPFFFPAYRAHKKSVKARISRAVSRSAKKAAGKS